jgi:hypothetical protein
MEYQLVNKIKRIYTKDEPEGVLRQRRGCIIIREHVLDDYPVLAQAIFSKFVPVQTFQLFVTSAVQYWGYSEEFDVVPEGSMVPDYEVLFHQDLMGRVTVKFEKTEEPSNSAGAKRLVSYN